MVHYQTDFYHFMTQKSQYSLIEPCYQTFSSVFRFLDISLPNNPAIHRQPF
jgi:hypothetical protein